MHPGTCCSLFLEHLSPHSTLERPAQPSRSGLRLPSFGTLSLGPTWLAAPSSVLYMGKAVAFLRADITMGSLSLPNLPGLKLPGSITLTLSTPWAKWTNHLGLEQQTLVMGVAFQAQAAHVQTPRVISTD